MSTSLLEIVDLGDGEVVLQRADDDSEPLVSIQFSEEASAYLPDGEQPRGRQAHDSGGYSGGG